MQVKVTYAPQDQCGPTEMFNPYDPLVLTVAGNIKTVANWLDEHVVAGDAALSAAGSKCEYEQGKMTPYIVQKLQHGGKFQLNHTTLLCEHVSDGGGAVNYDAEHQHS